MSPFIRHGSPSSIEFFFRGERHESLCTGWKAQTRVVERFVGELESQIGYVDIVEMGGQSMVGQRGQEHSMVSIRGGRVADPNMVRIKMECPIIIGGACVIPLPIAFSLKAIVFFIWGRQAENLNTILLPAHIPIIRRFHKNSRYQREY